MELPGSCALSLGVVMELTVSCHGVAWELSPVISSCHGIGLELSWSSPGGVLSCQELSWS